MGTKVGEIRESLMEAIELVKSRKMDPEAALAIAKLAAQVSLSLQVEANLMAQKISLDQVGNLPIGHEPKAIEQDNRPKPDAGASDGEGKRE